jgi:hypothetical protein
MQRSIGEEVLDDRSKCSVGVPRLAIDLCFWLCCKLRTLSYDETGGHVVSVISPAISDKETFLRLERWKGIQKVPRNDLPITGCSVVAA